MAQGAFPACPHIVTVHQGGYLTIPKGSVPYFPWISDSVDFTILDISDYDPPHVPSKTWRELIKKVWEVDPLTCQRCGSDLPAIGFAIIRHAQACALPIYFDGRNSSLFQLAGLVHPLFRTAMLAREFTNKTSSCVRVFAGKPVFWSRLKDLESDEQCIN
ncbi:MAG: hypothetical protein U9Q89_01615, partial [Thermodesulfobacteriota bacterium]|nr:hypothetical protein [Thermodesulfobacteriota bacterium]